MCVFTIAKFGLCDIFAPKVLSNTSYKTSYNEADDRQLLSLNIKVLRGRQRFLAWHEGVPHQQ